MKQVNGYTIEANANLEGANLEEADLEGASLENVTYNDNTKWPTVFIIPSSAVKV